MIAFLLANAVLAAARAVVLLPLVSLTDPLPIDLGDPLADMLTPVIRWLVLDLHIQTSTAPHELHPASSKHTNRQVNTRGVLRTAAAPLSIPRQRPKVR